MIWNTFNSCSSSLKTHTHLHVMWRSIKTDIGWDVESQARVEKPSRARFTSNRSWNSFFFRQAVKLLNSIGYNILFVSWHESRWKETLHSLQGLLIHCSKRCIGKRVGNDWIVWQSRVRYSYSAHAAVIKAWCRLSIWSQTCHFGCSNQKTLIFFWLYIGLYNVQVVGMLQCMTTDSFWKTLAYSSGLQLNYW